MPATAMKNSVTFNLLPNGSRASTKNIPKQELGNEIKRHLAFFEVGLLITIHLDHSNET